MTNSRWSQLYARPDLLFSIEDSSYTKAVKNANRLNDTGGKKSLTYGETSHPRMASIIDELVLQVSYVGF
jgi:hypothetical protein